MEDNKRDKGQSEFKIPWGIIFKVIGSILILLLLYFAYTPVPYGINSQEDFPSTGDFLLLVPLFLVLIGVLIYYRSIDKLWDILNQFIDYLNDHPYGKYINPIFVIAIISLILVLWNYPNINLSHAPARLSSSYEILNLRNIAIGFASIVGLILAVWRSVMAERQTKAIEERRVEERDEHKIAEERRLDERFANAVESLSKELNETSYPAHLGAITSLRDLALDSQLYTQRCIDIICSCNQWMERSLEKFILDFTQQCYADWQLNEVTRIAKESSSVKLHHEKRSQDALSAIAFILRNAEDDKLNKINFSGKMLCGINLSGLQIMKMDFRKANLQGANISNVNLSESNLEEANLRGVILKDANLQLACLQWANLQGAILDNAKLQGADLSYAKLQVASLIGANLQGASLGGSNLQATLLNRSNLQAADLCYSNLQGAELSFANFQGTALLGCNLYGASLHGADFTDIIFDMVYHGQYTVREGARDNFIESMGKLLANNDKQDLFISKILTAWDKIDKNELPREVDHMSKMSIVDKKLSLRNGDTTSLSDIYRKTAIELGEELNIPRSRVIDILNIKKVSYGIEHSNLMELTKSIRDRIKMDFIKEESEQSFFWKGFDKLAKDRFTIKATVASSSKRVITGLKPPHFTVRSDARREGEHYIRCQVRFDQKDIRQKEFQVFFNEEVQKRKLKAGNVEIKDNTTILSMTTANLYDESKWDEYYKWLLEVADLFMEIFNDYYN